MSQDRNLAFVASGHDYRAMVRDLVLDDHLADATVEPLQVRPEALQRLLEGLTGGHRWEETLDGYGTIRPLVNSLQGVRDLAGGGDHDHVLYPNFSPAPTVLLALDAVGRIAAEAAVDDGTVLDATLTEEAAVRAQLAALAVPAVGRRVATDDPLVDDLWALFDGALALKGDPSEAWRIALRGLYLDPQLVTY